MGEVDTESHDDNEHGAEHEQGEDALPVGANVRAVVPFQDLLLPLQYLGVEKMIRGAAVHTSSLEGKKIYLIGTYSHSPRNLSTSP